MLRSACRPERADASYALPPKLLAVSLGIFVAACSADVTRIDAQMFGLTGGSGNRTASAPIPRESVWSNGGSPSDTAYGQGYRPPQRERYVAAPPAQTRPVTRYAPADDRYRSSYETAPSRPANQAPPYRAAYGSPAHQPDDRQQGFQAPSYDSTYRPQPQSRVAALPPHSNREPLRSAPATRAAPDRTANRPAPQRATPAANAHEIEVEPGDTLYGLAERHDVSISQLMTMNGLTSPVLRPGQRLMLPKGARVIADSGRRSYGSAGTRTTAFSETSPPVEQAADALQAPEESRTAAFGDAPPAYEPADTYTIKRGESLYGIAVREGVSLAELQRINNIDNPRTVRAGTVLRLPSSSSSSGRGTTVPTAPRAIAQSESGQRVAPAASSAAIDSTAESSTEPATEPVIINRPQRVASLGKPETASDALPLSAAPSSAAEPAPTPDSRTAEEQADGIGKFRWPARGRVIAGFGKQPDGSQSDGIKLAVPVGTEVHAAESGVVAYADSVLKDYGNLILLRHDDGWISAYAHNDELLVKRGDRVRRGQVIAKAGKSGNAETPQLHFELRKGSSPVDPIPHLEKF